MRLALAALLAGLVPAASVPTASQAQLPAPRPGAISGIVVNAATGQPVPGAGVTIRGLTGPESVSGATFPRMITDRQGRFAFPEVPPGDYFLDANRLGYAHTRYGWAAPGGSLALRDIARLTVTEGGWLSNVRVPLWQLASIEGRVFDERGEPVVGTVVRVLSVRRIAGNEQLVGGPIATTDDRGVYYLANLDPGRYVVGALSVQHTVLDTTPEAPADRPLGELDTGGIGASRGIFVRGPTTDGSGRHRLALSHFAMPPPPDGGETRVYAATYYPGSATPGQAAPIDVGYGDVRTGVDIQIVPMPAVRVSGRAEVPPGPPPSLLLRLLPTGSEQLGFGFEAATTVLEPDGQFTFLNVPQGSYTLVAQSSVMDFTSGDVSHRFGDAPGFPGGGISVGSMPGAPGLGYLSRSGQRTPCWGRMPVNVGRDPIDDLHLTLHPTGAIRGRIVLDDGTQPGERGRVELQALPASGDPTLGMAYGNTSTTDPERAFAIEGLLAGRYLLRSADTHALLSVMANGRNVADAGVEIVPGQDVSDVVVTLTSRTAAVVGRVSGLVDLPAAVIVFPADRRLWTDYGWRPARLRSTRSATNGAYSIDSLPAGDYFVVAVDPVHINAWTDPKFLESASTVATRTTLDWGGRATVDLVLREVVVR